MAAEHSYARLGFFMVVVLVVVLATGLLFIQRLRSREVIEAVTYTTENVSGLEVSSPVRYRGVSVGRIPAQNGTTSEFLGKLNNWFDQTMDRVSDLFTARIQVVTFVASLSVALLFQVNAFELINRLSVDDALRNKVVAIAIDRAKQGSPQTEVESTGAADATNSTAAANAADSTPYQSANLTETATDSDGTNVAENAADTAANNLTGNATVPDAAAETPGAIGERAAGRDAHGDVAVRLDATGEIDHAAIIIDAAAADRHAITVGAVAIAALGYDENAPIPVIHPLRGRHVRQGGNTQERKNSGTEKSADH